MQKLLLSCISFTFACVSPLDTDYHAGGLLREQFPCDALTCVVLVRADHLAL